MNANNTELIPLFSDVNSEIKMIFQFLTEWIHLPSYQAERRVDIFIAIYLPKILKHANIFDTEDISIIPEFPLKKEQSNRSDKIDYLATDGKKLVAIELKTDATSRRPEQDDYYKRFLQEDYTWTKITDTIKKDISSHSSKKDKYQYLISKYLDQSPWKELKPQTHKEVVYLQPKGKSYASHDNIEVVETSKDGRPAITVIYFEHIVTTPIQSDDVVWSELKQFLETIM